MHASNFNLHSICISYFVLVYYLYEAVRMFAYFIYIVYITYLYRYCNLSVSLTLGILWVCNKMEDGNAA